ncbi:MAG: hypothetical protein A2152_03020 [Candidatus Levybacteria bacterium RBG_16_35_6]|nr:MAG: hypothetical protein A2152_03020 [Candidatus Levybacteria bacterium RBG_16_35_6]
MAKEQKDLKETITKLFKLLEIDGKFEIKEGEDLIEITLDAKDSGMIIGYHGDTLDSLQLILALCLSKKREKFKRVSIEVGDYKKNRSEWLKNLALQTKERVISENKEIQLYDLKAWERRVIHLMLQDDQEVVSESSGEGKDRVLVVKPRG